jgi:glycosyltransferase involved in cell wall biosynthesis
VTEARPRVLWIMSNVPWPLDQGNRFIAYNLLKHLRDRFEITLVVPVKDAEERERAKEIEKLVRVIPVPRSNTRSTLHRILGRLGYRLRCLTRGWTMPEVHYENFPALHDVVVREASSGRYDLAFLHYWFLYPLVEAMAPLPAAVLLHDNEPQRIESEIEAHPERAATLTRARDVAVAGHERLLAAATRVLFYSQEDLDDWTARAGAEPPNATVFPYMFDFAPARERAEVEGRLLFTGHMSYGPNVDAVVWFADEVFPLIRAERPDATFRIAGKQPAPEVAALADRDGIEVTGWVDDMLDEIAHAAVYVAPIRFGGGLKIKILEAGGQACPVVATTCALRGFGLDGSERAVRRADEPGALARAALDLLADATARAEGGRRLRKRLVDRFGPAATGSRIEGLIRGLVSR